MAFRTGFCTESSVECGAEKPLTCTASPCEGCGSIRQLRKGDSKVMRGMEINTNLAHRVLRMVVVG